MKKNNVARKRLAVTVAVALLGFAGGTLLSTLPSWLPSAFAQEHEGGKGGGKGGKGGGGGHDEGGGCGGGGCGGGGHEGGGEAGKGGEHAMHGTKAGHVGHAAGVHNSANESGVPHGSHNRVMPSDRRFGAGTGLATLDAVPEGPARSQPGNLSTSGARHPLRYWGGWTVPAADVPAVPATAETVPLGSGGGGGAGLGLSLMTQGRCEGIGSNTSAPERIAGRNLARINGAQALIAPRGVRPETVAPYLLANLQEELEKPRPDLQLAAVYLGTAAAQPVTPQVVKQVGSALCVAIGDASAASIAAAAEEQRLGKSTLSVARQSSGRR